MEEISKKEIDEIKKGVGFEEVGEYARKKVKIINDNLQLKIRIPKRFVEVLKIDESKDVFEFKMIPLENGEFELKGELIRG